MNANTDMAANNIDCLEAYSKYKSPMPAIMILTVLFTVISGYLAVRSPVSVRVLAETLLTPETAKDYSGRWIYDRHILVLYVCAFTSWWVVYFSSRKPPTGKDPKWKQWRTLRRLLGETATQWSPVQQAALTDSYQEKARSTMQFNAILIAVSGIELTHAMNTFSSLLEDSIALTFKEGVSEWQILILAAAIFAAIIAFISLIISSDSMDVLFNKFKSTPAEEQVIGHYYRITINPRYAALVSLIVSFLLLVGYFSPTIAAAAIGVFFVVGYRHWFPDFRPRHWHTMVRSLGFLIKVSIVLFPFVPLLYALGRRL